MGDLHEKPTDCLSLGEDAYFSVDGRKAGEGQESRPVGGPEEQLQLQLSSGEGHCLLFLPPLGALASEIMCPC